MIRIGKSIAGLSSRTLRTTVSFGISSSLRSFRYTSPGAGSSSSRCFSATTAVSNAGDGGVETAICSNSLDISSSSQDIDIVSIIDGMSSSIGVVTLTAADLGFYPPHLAIQAIENMHLMAGIPYWEAIILTTFTMRLILLPSGLKVVRDVSRMKALKPEMKAIKESFSSGVSSAEDPTVRFKYGAAITQLFKEHKIYPAVPVAISSIQIPIFLSFFFGLREMGAYCPGYMTGGESWFTDLSCADTTYFLPIMNAATFLLMIELGADPHAPNPMRWVRSCVKL